MLYSDASKHYVVGSCCLLIFSDGSAPSLLFSRLGEKTENKITFFLILIDIFPRFVYQRLFSTEVSCFSLLITEFSNSEF